MATSAWTRISVSLPLKNSVVYGFTHYDSECIVLGISQPNRFRLILSISGGVEKA